MGCDFQLACDDCKTICFLGYGSYGSWGNCSALTADEYAASVKPEMANLYQNKNAADIIRRHEGHTFHIFSDDWADFVYDDGTLKAMQNYVEEEPPIPQHSL